MSIAKFFSTDERLKVLDCLFFNPKTRGVRETAREIGVSPSVVSKCLAVLKKEKIFDERTGLLCPEGRALKVYLCLERIRASKIALLIKKEFKPVSAGLYGSWADGTNTRGSDIDLWVKVKGKIPEGKVLGVRREIRKRLKVEPSILVLAAEDVDRLRAKDYPFYCSLAHSIVLIGEGID